MLSNNQEKTVAYMFSEATAYTTPKIISDKSGSPTIFKTNLQDVEYTNRNKKIYEKAGLESGFQSDYIQERLRTKSLYGEAGHPRKPDLERQMSYDQDRISHIVTDIKWNGNIVEGIVETALTTCGYNMQGLIRQGSIVGMSLRGYGPVVEKKGDIIVVKAPIHVFCYDWVVHPSHKIAYLQQIIQESTSPYDDYDSFKRDSFYENNKDHFSSEGSYFIPIEDESLKDYIANESANFKRLTDQLEFEKPNILGKKDDLVYFSEGTTTVAGKIEDYINHDITKFLSNI